MKKKFLALALALVMLLALVPVVAQADVVDNGTCGDNLTWTLDDQGTLTISGTGAMVDYAYKGTGVAPWLEQKDSITRIVIEKGVTSIGNYAFYGCQNLTSITIPDSVTSIGASAVGNCTGLSSVTIPGSVTSIGTQVFAWCSGLTSVTILDGVTSIGSNEFQGCTSLTSITIPDSVTSIGTQAFRNCTSLNSITIPKNVTSIGSSAFLTCSGLTSVNFEGAPTIGTGAFNYCTKINSVTVPASGATSILGVLGTTVVGNLTELNITGSDAEATVAELNNTYHFDSKENIVVKANETVVYGTPAPTVGDIELTYMQGTLGWANEYTIGIKINDSNVTVNDIVLKLEGESNALPKETESAYETSRFTCYTVTEDATYGYLFKIKIFARHLGTKINISVPEHTVMDWYGVIGESCGYSMVDYANLANYTDLATTMSEYAVEVAKLPTD